MNYAIAIIFSVGIIDLTALLRLMVI